MYGISMENQHDDQSKISLRGEPGLLSTLLESWSVLSWSPGPAFCGLATPCQCPSPFFWTPDFSVEAMGTLNTQLEETKTFGDQPEGPCAP